MSAKDRQPYPIAWHDFDIFKGCFGDTRIMPSDVDFIVERKGYFLFIELKVEGKKIFTGQHRLLKELGKNPKFTVVLAYHKPRTKCGMCGSIHDIPEFTGMKVYYQSPLRPCTTEGVVKFVSNWYTRINLIK